MAAPPSEIPPPPAEAVELSLLSWMYHALGPFYGTIIPLAGLAVLVGACLVVARSRRPAVIAAYFVFVPIPFLIGIYGTLYSYVSGFWAVTESVTIPKPFEVYTAYSCWLALSLTGFLATLPAYLVTSIGLFIQTLRSERPPQPAASSLSDPSPAKEDRRT